jgi:hypothetical protein
MPNIRNVVGGLLGLACCISLSACDTYTAAPYSISMDNDVVLKKFAPKNVTVGAFTAPSSPSMLCRLVGPIHLPGDVPPQDYISKALADELELAGLSSGTGSGITLTGEIDHFDFNSMIGSGNWQLGVTITSSNGKSLAVLDNYSFHSSFVGDAACHDVADAFEPAVQSLTEKLVSDPGFPALLN